MRDRMFVSCFSAFDLFFLPFEAVFYLMIIYIFKTLGYSTGLV